MKLYSMKMQTIVSNPLVQKQMLLYFSSLDNYTSKKAASIYPYYPLLSNLYKKQIRALRLSAKSSDYVALVR